MQASLKACVLYYSMSCFYLFLNKKNLKTVDWVKTSITLKLYNIQFHGKVIPPNTQPSRYLKIKGKLL